jgi:hypothetical protein
MPARSQAQQKAAGAALSAKRGETPKKALKGASRSMAASMDERQLEELAATKRKGKPEHVGKGAAGKASGAATKSSAAKSGPKSGGKSNGNGRAAAR